MNADNEISPNPYKAPIGNSPSIATDDRLHAVRSQSIAFSGTLDDSLAKELASSILYRLARTFSSLMDLRSSRLYGKRISGSVHPSLVEIEWEQGHGRFTLAHIVQFPLIGIVVQQVFIPQKFLELENPLGPWNRRSKSIVRLDQVEAPEHCYSIIQQSWIRRQCDWDKHRKRVLSSALIAVCVLSLCVGVILLVVGGSDYRTWIGKLDAPQIMFLYRFGNAFVGLAIACLAACLLSGIIAIVLRLGAKLGWEDYARPRYGWVGQDRLSVGNRRWQICLPWDDCEIEKITEYGIQLNVWGRPVFLARCDFETDTAWNAAKRFATAKSMKK